MRSAIQVRGRDGFHDGPYSIGITNIATGQTTVPPLAFPTREAAESVVDAIITAAPDLYTGGLLRVEEGS